MSDIILQISEIISKIATQAHRRLPNADLKSI